ncbi:MAG: ferrochelatase, partial [Ramlibacter sp.]
QARRPGTAQLRSVRDYHDDADFIEAWVKRVRSYWQMHGRPDKLLMSFHGVPVSTIVRGDSYERECHETARRLGERLGWAEGDYLITFQSRFGKAKWLEPATEPTLRELGRAGTGRVDVVCPGFPCDCLETLEEIAMEGRDAFLESGGREFHHIPCLNDSDAWIGALASLVEKNTADWR